MGLPIFEWKSIPIKRKFRSQKVFKSISLQKFTDGFCLNIGNPHIFFLLKIVLNMT